MYMQDFQEIYDKQLIFEDLVISKNKNWPDKKLNEFSEDEKVAYTKEMVLYLHKELGEVLDAVGNYRMHKTKREDPKVKEIPEEVADCFIFVLNLALTHGLTAEDLLDIVVAKQAKNFRRQEEGY
jgi:NTP pyrophosphatase (non-canonical NTP hydrolase)